MQKLLDQVNKDSYVKFLQVEQGLNINSAAYKQCFEAYGDFESIIFDSYLTYLAEGSQHLDEEV